MDVVSLHLPIPAQCQKSSVSDAVLRTLAYSDLFDFPLKPEEIHFGLVAYEASPEKIRHALNNGLRQYVEKADGFYYLKGRKHLIPARKQKEQETLRIIAKNKRFLKLLCCFPFVRSVNLSGAIAFKNCTRDDDIDLFLIIDPRRTWSTYIAILTVLKILGKRRTFCLNYIYGKEDFHIREHDFFIAHQIANLRPISGRDTYREFFAKNLWIRDFLPQSRAANGRFFADTSIEKSLSLTRKQIRIKELLEKIFGIALFDAVEFATFKLFRWLLNRRLSRSGGSILLEKDELKLFTNDHRQRVLQKFRQRLEHLTGQTWSR